ncbi:MAG: haloacid dehalogenase-like hydrolase [Lachnospiraceae bacterium]|nr:haloacid dehalogenase-like hydrolase [Lachnospiraceae bacterium]
MKKNSKIRIVSVMMILTMLLSVLSVSGCGKNSSKALLQYWAADAEAAKSLRDYVAAVTNEKDSENYIPKEDRIAVFDMDGTLTCETFYTYYDTMMFINFCLEDHPEKVSEELKAAAREIKPGYTAGEELARNFAKAYAGMTVQELYDYAVEFGRKNTDSFNNMRYIDGFYLPMVEVVRYLHDNGFEIYVVSGTERTTTRAIVDNSPISEYVPSDHVIGTEFEVKVKGNEDVSSNMDYKYADGDELVFTGGFIQKNLNANKTIWIEREIGKMPVLAFGNSGSDTSMMNYALDDRNPYQSRAYMVVADDNVREWGSQDWNEKSAQYREQGYVPISMKNDFLKIYPDTVTRADVQYIETTIDVGSDKAADGKIIPFPVNTSSEDNTAGQPTAEPADENLRPVLSREGYTLKQAVVLSRHNIRAPLSGAGSALDAITPHKWFEWSAEASQLSVRGGTLETEMGQYFRKWLESEGLFEPNYRPEDGAVRIYANAKQRTIATAQFFAAGLLPVSNIDVEYNAEFDTMDPVFNPVLTYVSAAYVNDALDEIHDMYAPVIDDLEEDYELLFDVIDAKDSDDYKNGNFEGFKTDDQEFSLEEGKEPAVSGSLKKACQVSDALVLQYFEESDKEKAAFGHDLSDEDWEAISEIKDVYGDVLFTAPSVAVNVAHPLLEELNSEMTADGRKFTFLCGHDSNLASVLAALEVEDYSLPGTIEKKTPIGAKLVMSRWAGEDGEEMISLDLVYQKTEQLQELSLLGDDNPPAVYSLRLKGLNADENGMYEAGDVMKRLEAAIKAYDDLQEKYDQQEAA